MRLTVVGCAGSFPGPDSAASCYLIEHDGHRILLDLGSGALGPLQLHTQLERVEAVVLSHLHPDHCLDLTGLDVARTYHGPQPPPELLVLGPPDTAARLRRASEVSEGSARHTSFTIREHVPVTEVGPFRIRTVAVVHPVPAYATRIEAGGRTLVYSGDTAPTQALVEMAKGADLALFEATWFEGDDNPPGLHLTGTQAGRHAAAAEVGRLVLTHLVPGRDQDRTRQEAAAHYSGELTLAAAAASYDI
ncbi:MAG TPA: MBL fold metallo-hydrolase [Candidatus Nanopelagicales bacterium]|jgi:ribonuclease BN (tRNA processing enzyme)